MPPVSHILWEVPPQSQSNISTEVGACYSLLYKTSTLPFPTTRCLYSSHIASTACHCLYHPYTAIEWLYMDTNAYGAKYGHSAAWPGPRHGPQNRAPRARHGTAFRLSSPDPPASSTTRPCRFEATAFLSPCLGLSGPHGAAEQPDGSAVCERSATFHSRLHRERPG